jgi:hypothetical protein
LLCILMFHNFDIIKKWLLTGGIPSCGILF